jgi:predicted aconitase
MTLEEVLPLSAQFEGRRVRKRTWFCVVPEALERYRQTSEYRSVRAAGVQVNEWCPLAALSVQLRRKAVVTPSAKLFYYLDNTEYGNEDDCLAACGVCR